MCLGYEDLNEQLRAKNAPQSVVMIASASSRFLFWFENFFFDGIGAMSRQANTVKLGRSGGYGRWAYACRRSFTDQPSWMIGSRRGADISTQFAKGVCRTPRLRRPFSAWGGRTGDETRRAGLSGIRRIARLSLIREARPQWGIGYSSSGKAKP